VLDSVVFAPGEHTIILEGSITTQGPVRLKAGADVTFRAPTMRFGQGFGIEGGAHFKTLIDEGYCIVPTSRELGGTTVARQSAGDADVEDTDYPFAHQPIGHTEQLPGHVQELLSLYGVSPDAAEDMLLDAQGWWLLLATSEALLPADNNGVHDIYRLDLFTESLTLLSRTAVGAAGNGPSRYPAADATGELVVFQSEANDLVAVDTNAVSDIFLHDVPLGETSRITLLDAGAAEHPALDAAAGDVLYDQRGEDGQRQVRLDGLWDDTPAETVSLVEDSAGRLLDNHHPAISAGGRYVAYLEARADAGESVCQVHVYDRDTDRYLSTPCPDALAAEPEAARPYFSGNGMQVEWLLPDVDSPVVVPNPLHAAPASVVE